MDFEKILNLGVKKGLIDDNQKNGLLDLYRNNEGEAEQVSTVVKVFYYIGGFIMLAAMTLLMSNTIQHSTYAVILALGIIYSIMFLGIGEYLWRREEKFAAGILYFLFIAAFGLIVMDIEKMIGFFPHFSEIDQYQNYFEVCRLPIITLSTITIIANMFLLKYRQVSSLVLPIVFCFSLIYMVCVEWIFGFQNLTNKIMSFNNLIFAIALAAVAYTKDRLTKVDYSKWLYFFGATGIYSSIWMLFNEYINTTWVTQLLVLIMSIIFVFIGLVIQRKPFSIIGALGTIQYFIYLVTSNLGGNITFITSVILIMGLIILYAGVLYNKNVERLEAFIKSKLPEKIRKHLPQNRVQLSD